MAISPPLGLTMPAMYKVIGVAAVNTPSSATERRRRHSAAVTTALASSAEQSAADISRIRYSPCGPLTSRLGQPVAR